MLLLKSQLNLNKLLKSHLLHQMPLLQVLKVNNQPKMEKVKQLKRSLLMLPLRLVLLSEERKLEMRLLKKEPPEILKEQKMFQLQLKLKLRMMLNQLKRQKKNKLQLITRQQLKKLSQLKSKQPLQTLQPLMYQLNERCIISVV